MSTLSGRRAGEARDALLAFARDAHRAGVEIPAAIADLARDLHAEALAAHRAISEVGNKEAGRETIDDMRTWGTPDEVGKRVGLSGRRVRMLCADESVASRRIGGGRYLVDLADLQRHLRETA